MKIEQGTFCPLLKKDCIQLKCNWFIQIRGKNPNTGEDVDEWGCSIAWLPMLLINTANETRQGAAATESFRNEMVKCNNVQAEMLNKQANATQDLKFEIEKATEIQKAIMVHSLKSYDTEPNQYLIEDSRETNE